MAGARRRLAVTSLLGAVAIIGASAYAYVTHPTSVPQDAPLLAGFASRSYRPADVAHLRIDSAGVSSVTLQVFHQKVVNRA